MSRWNKCFFCLNEANCRPVLVNYDFKFKECPDIMQLTSLESAEVFPNNGEEILCKTTKCLCCSTCLELIQKDQNSAWLKLVLELKKEIQELKNKNLQINLAGPSQKGPNFQIPQAHPSHQEFESNGQDHINKCHTCEKQFANSKDLESHILCTHLKSINVGMNIEKILVCKECGKLCLEKKLKKHIDEVHKGLKICKTCGKTFKNFECLRGHIANIHRKKKIPPKKFFKCVIDNDCKEKFKTDAELEEHVLEKHSNFNLTREDVNERLLARYKKESDRLKTFKNCWPKSAIPPEKFVKAGFIYTRREDNVQCVYCGGVIGDFDDDDDPMTEHEQFPNCPFVVENFNIENSTNVQDQN